MDISWRFVGMHDAEHAAACLHCARLTTAVRYLHPGLSCSTSLDLFPTHPIHPTWPRAAPQRSWAARCPHAQSRAPHRAPPLRQRTSAARARAPPAAPSRRPGEQRARSCQSQDPGHRRFHTLPQGCSCFVPLATASSVVALSMFADLPPVSVRGLHKCLQEQEPWRVRERRAHAVRGGVGFP